MIKRKNPSQFIAIIIILMLFTTAFPMTSFAENQESSLTVSTLKELQEAVKNSADGATINLGQNITFAKDEILDVAGKNIIIKNASDSAITIKSGFISGSGTITFEEGINFKGQDASKLREGLKLTNGTHAIIKGDIVGADTATVYGGNGLTLQTIDCTVDVFGNIKGGKGILNGGGIAVKITSSEKETSQGAISVKGDIVGGESGVYDATNRDSTYGAGLYADSKVNGIKVTINGNVSGGGHLKSGSSNSGIAGAGLLINSKGGTYEIHGNVSGGKSNTSVGGTGVALYYCDTGLNDIKITGNVSGGDGYVSGGYGIDHSGKGNILIIGDVTGGNGDNSSIYGSGGSSICGMSYGGSITINGNANGGSGYKSSSLTMDISEQASEDLLITINGNVTAGQSATKPTPAVGTAINSNSDKIFVEVKGNVTGEFEGLKGRNITVTGDVEAKEGNGVDASGEVKVKGNITGKQIGVKVTAIERNAAVTVNGNITGTAEYGALAALTGVYTSTVTCDGTITGGISASADDAAVKTLLGESYTVGTYINNKSVVKTDLTNAISAAKTNKETVTVSPNGEDVAPTSKWVTSAVRTAYEGEIAQAQTVVDNTNATQTEVDTAIAALHTATTTFDKAKAAGTKVDTVKTALTNAISTANTNKGTVTVSTDGKDVSTTSKWVTSAVQKAYTDAIAQAQAVVDNANAKQTEVDTAIAALHTATTTFDKAKAAGTKTSSGGSSNNGGGGGKASSSGSSSTPTTTTTTAKVDKKADSTGAATVKASEMKSADTLKVSGNSSADNATLQFDNKAVGAIVAAAGTGDIKISAEKIEKTALTSEQKEKIESLTKSNASQDQPIYSFKVTVGDKKVTDFKSGKVSIEVDYKPTTKGTDNLIVFHIKDNGDVEVIKDCKYDAKTGKLAFSASGFSYFMVGNAADLKASFGDVAKGAWYYDSVSYLLDKNLIKGKTETTFAPEANITRAEFVQTLYNMSKNIQGTNTEGVNFQDVNAGAWYYEAVAWGSKAGVVTGANNQFRPEDKISRQEMAVILDRYTSNVAKVTLNKTAEKISFKDSAAIGTWANAAVTTMQQTGIINGIADNGAYKFAPKENATRAQAAKMIAALVKQI